MKVAEEHEIPFHDSTTKQQRKPFKLNHPEKNEDLVLLLLSLHLSRYSFTLIRYSFSPLEMMFDIYREITVSQQKVIKINQMKRVLSCFLN